MASGKSNIILELERMILPLQGLQLPAMENRDHGLHWGMIRNHFPQRCFPTGAIHEFICTHAESGAATTGFIAAILGALMLDKGVAIWITRSANLFPPGLVSFGIEPHRLLILRVKNEQEALWAMEESLKCASLTAVVSDIREIGFIASRRLQLVVEKSRVTGFLVRHQPKNIQPIAAVARWKIHSLPGVIQDKLPGVGFVKWSVELERIRNGQPGKWEVAWTNRQFTFEGASIAAMTNKGASLAEIPDEATSIAGMTASSKRKTG